jgi:hypothetical protein
MSIIFISDEIVSFFLFLDFDLIRSGMGQPLELLYFGRINVKTGLN